MKRYLFEFAALAPAGLMFRFVTEGVSDWRFWALIVAFTFSASSMVVISKWMGD